MKCFLLGSPWSYAESYRKKTEFDISENFLEQPNIKPSGKKVKGESKKKTTKDGKNHVEEIHPIVLQGWGGEAQWSQRFQALAKISMRFFIDYFFKIKFKNKCFEVLKFTCQCLQKSTTELLR